MSENLQHIDDIFRDTIEPHDENPSPAVWESLQAQLDKEDAATYKRRFIIARRVSITLLLLLICFVIYETGLNKSGSQRLAIQNKIKNEVVNKPGNERTEEIKSSKKISSQNSSLTIQQHSFNTDKNADRSQHFFEKTVVTTDETVTLKKNKTEKPSYRLNNKVALLKEKNKLVDDVFKLHAKNERYIYNRNKSNTPYLTRKNFNKSINTVVFDKSKEGKLFANKHDFLFPRTVLADLQRYNLMVTTDRLYGVTGIIVSYTKLTLPDSLTAAVANVIKKKKQDKTFKPYWTVTAIASPEWTQYNLENDVPDNGSNQQDEKTQIEQRENHEPSFSAGIIASYQFKKHWAIQTGLLYSKTAIAIEPQKIYAAKESNGEIAYKYNSSSGYAFVKPGFGLPPIVGDSLTTTSSQHNLQYISLPIILKYKIEKNRFSISPALGVSANFLTSAKIQTEVKDALNRETVNISKLEGTKPFYLGLMANADIQYQFNKKWSLNIMPSFRYAVTPVTKDNVVKTYPYSFGIGLGMSYRF